MPDIKAPKETRHLNLDEIRYLFDDKRVNTTEALNLVCQTFSHYETERNSNHEQRWSEQERLYAGYVEPRFWPGTKEPRAALGVPLAFDQVESIYPLITSEIFTQHPYWFDVTPAINASTTEARAVRSVMAEQVDTPNPFTHEVPRQHLKLAIRDCLIHGNCAIEAGWDPNAQRIVWDWCPLNDLYFELNARTPFIDRSPSVIRRRMVSVQDLEELRKVEGFDIPSPEILNYMAKTRPVTVSESQEQANSSLKSPNTGGFTGQSKFMLPPNPAAQQIELLQYWTDERMIWVLNRKIVITNDTNPYGFKPFVFAPLFLLLREPYALSVPDVVGGDQQLIQGLVNARIDELSLGLRPPRIVDPTTANRNTKGQLEWKPGGVTTSENPRDAQVMFPQNMTQNAFNEVSLAQARIEARTGANRMTVAGTPTPSNANRTAGGVSAQRSATSTRLLPMLENIEDYLVIPLLQKSLLILSKFLPADRNAVGIDPNGENIIVPRIFVNGAVRFKVGAGSRMVTRDRLLQVFQPLSSVLLSDGTNRSLQALGKTVDFEEYMRFVWEALGTEQKFKFIRPVNEQEQQAAQQPDPTAQLKAQMQEKEFEVRRELGQMKAQAEIQSALISAESKLESTKEAGAGNIIAKLMDTMQKRGASQLDAETKAKQALASAQQGAVNGNQMR